MAAAGECARSSRARRPRSDREAHGRAVAGDDIAARVLHGHDRLGAERAPGARTGRLRREHELRSCAGGDVERGARRGGQAPIGGVQLIAATHGADLTAAEGNHARGLALAAAGECARSSRARRPRSDREAHGRVVAGDDVAARVLHGHDRLSCERAPSARTGRLRRKDKLPCRPGSALGRLTELQESLEIAARVSVGAAGAAVVLVRARDGAERRVRGRRRVRRCRCLGGTRRAGLQVNEVARVVAARIVVGANSGAVRVRVARNGDES